MTPLVSILLPVYNGEQFLQECLDSIAAQTYKNWELIVVNDGSTDNSALIIENFIKNTNRQVKSLSFQHKGISYCLNQGVKIAVGKYIARMDADDVMLPDRLSLQVDFLENNAEVDVLGGHAAQIDDKGNAFSDMILPLDDAEIKHSLNYTCPFAHAALMIRIEILQQNLYKEIKQYPEDVELWMRLEKKATFRNLDAILIKRRYHKNQITQSGNIFWLRVYKLYLIKNISGGNFRLAARNLRKALTYLRPRSFRSFLRGLLKNK